MKTNFYFLHLKDEKHESESDFKYLICLEDKLREFNKIVIDGEEYCPHESLGDYSWDYDDSVVTVTTHEKSIKAKFIKSELNNLGFEIWVNENFIS